MMPGNWPKTKIVARMHNAIDLEIIRMRAYEKYEYRRDTGPHLIFDNGRLREVTPQDDWIEAEREHLRGED